MIPSAPKIDEDSSEDEESTKPIVPVMRRHGEPLMVMPDWQPDAEKREHGRWFSEPKTEHGHGPISSE